MNHSQTSKKISRINFDWITTNSRIYGVRTL